MRCCSAVVLLAICVTASLAAQQRTGDTATDNVAALGAQLASRVREQTTPLPIAAVNEYVTDLGLRLATEIPNAPAHWQFTVVTTTGNWAHEPLGLPGGYVFIPAALIASAENEAEFAAMLAHAMMDAASPAILQWAGGTVPLIFVETDLESDGHDLIPLSLRDTQLGRELEADALALEALARAGYDPSALLAYLEHEQPRNTGRSQEDRRLINARLTSLRRRLASLKTDSGEMRLSSSNFERLKDRVRGAEQASVYRHQLPSLFTPAR